MRRHCWVSSLMQSRRSNTLPSFVSQEMISKAHKRIKEEKNIESGDSPFTALLSRSGKHSVTFLEAGTGQTQPNSGLAHEEGKINAVENAAGITDLEKPSELQASKDTLQITKILDEFVSKKRIANTFSLGIPDFPGSKPTNQCDTRNWCSSSSSECCFDAVRHGWAEIKLSQWRSSWRALH